MATYRETNYLETLITCHMISEGIDIRSVKNIILFSSDRQRLETVQRIGRAFEKIQPTQKSELTSMILSIWNPSSPTNTYRQTGKGITG